MPPMSEAMDMFAGQTRKTNFSIDAIMSTPKIKEEDVFDEDIDVGKEEVDADIVDPALVEKIKKESKPSRISEKSNCATLDNIKCNLDNKDLWDKFSEFGTEMIITRTGRRMFPTMRCTFGNLDMDVEPGTKFHILLDIVPCDNKRYRYAYHRSTWLVAGKADPAPPHRLYAHPDGPFTVDQLKKQVTSFEKVKITNNESDNTGQIILNSMHKFQPRVYLVMRREGEHGPVTDIEKERFRTFVFPESQFTAVTAYQNQLITKLKIESNPFAKGFRDTGSDLDDQHHAGSPYGMPGLHNMSHLPGGMPGIDPFTRIGQRLQSESNNNMMMAAEKARMMMMYPNRPLLSPPSSSLPNLPTSFPIPSELLARYSAMQASLGLYNPALLAAAIRNSSSSSSPSSLNSSLSSPRSPDLTSPRLHRFSPYVVPRSTSSPSNISPRAEDDQRTPSPGSSPPAMSRPAFPIFR